MARGGSGPVPSAGYARINRERGTRRKRCGRGSRAEQGGTVGTGAAALACDLFRLPGTGGACTSRARLPAIDIAAAAAAGIFATAAAAAGASDASGWPWRGPLKTFLMLTLLLLLLLLPLEAALSQ